MPDSDGQGERTLAEAETEYKKLQRKLNRVTAKWQDSEARLADLASAAPRMETLMEGLATLVAGSDEQLKPIAEDLVKRNTAQRGTDTSANSATARLGQLVDDADEDWMDSKFDSARRVVEAINESGDMGRIGEAERLVKEALEPSQEDFDTRVQTAVAKALLEEKQGRTRVDSSSSAAIDGKVRRSELAEMDPRKEGIAEMQAKTKKALDQMFGT